MPLWGAQVGRAACHHPLQFPRTKPGRRTWGEVHLHGGNAWLQQKGKGNMTSWLSHRGAARLQRTHGSEGRHHCVHHCSGRNQPKQHISVHVTDNPVHNSKSPIQGILHTVTLRSGDGSSQNGEEQRHHPHLGAGDERACSKKRLRRARQGSWGSTVEVRGRGGGSGKVTCACSLLWRGWCLAWSRAGHGMPLHSNYGREWAVHGLGVHGGYNGPALMCLAGGSGARLRGKNAMSTG